MVGFKHVLVFVSNCFLCGNFGVGGVFERLVKMQFVFKRVVKSLTT
jgi:hypothetical protein